jgi:hypothetical protein
MRRPFASEPNSISNSARFSASIRPLTVKITSPFADLVILSILPLFDISLPGGRVGLFGYGNRNSNCNVINLDALAADKMSELRQLLKFPTAGSGAIVFCGWVEMRLAGFRGVGSLEAILVDLQGQDLRF